MDNATSLLKVRTKFTFWTSQEFTVYKRYILDFRENIYKYMRGTQKDASTIKQLDWGQLREKYTGPLKKALILAYAH